jgi:hypothetical protein
MVSQRRIKSTVESNGATIDAIGANSDRKNPPFCKIAFFFLRETDFFVSTLNSALFPLSFSFFVNCQFWLSVFK